MQEKQDRQHLTLRSVIAISLLSFRLLVFSMISRRQVRYFLAVAQAGQVSAAARLINVSQSTVTLAIKDLETHLGTALFTRDPRGFFLTEAGHKFLAHARDIEASFTAAERHAAEYQEGRRGTVRLGMSETISGYFAFPILSRFARSHPEITIELREMPRPELEAALLAGDLDLSLLLISNLSAGVRLASRLLHRSTRHVWAAPAHPLARLKEVALADVALHPMALLDSDEANRQPERFWSPETGIPNVIFTSRSIEAVRNIVASGRAVTILSDVIYRPWTLDGMRVEKIPLADPVPTMDIGLAWDSSVTPASSVEALRRAFEGWKPVSATDPA